MPEFDKNAGFLWAIILLGVLIPLLLTGFAWLRAHFAHKRLQRLQSEDEAGRS